MRRDVIVCALMADSPTTASLSSHAMVMFPSMLTIAPVVVVCGSAVLVVMVVTQELPVALPVLAPLPVQMGVVT